MYNILICDDDRDIVNALKIYLSDPQYKLYEAYNGREALDIIAQHEIQLILMDIMMPQMDGMQAMVKIREHSNVPVILLTAKSEDNDKVLGLNIGADDYITKPFNPMEVTARVRSQLRRYTQLGSAQMTSSVLTVDGIELNDNAKTVTLDGSPVTLTPTEFDILKMLMEHAGTVYSPKEIYEKVWKEDAIGNESTTVAVHIRHLREKLEIDPNEPRTLKVVWGQGYKMEGKHEK
jgi:Response regulators consisting of a CheY-like receiver domain and a winged-helix DNA-binding domain